MESKKIEEGNELIRQAEKSLKTGLLKWRPDYDIAADEYTKAATAFRNAKAYDQSIDCLLKSANCHKNNRSWFHAAKCHEQITLLLKDKGDILKIEENANKAAHLYQQHGSPEAAVTALDKAAKVLETDYPEIALRLYQSAVGVVTIEDSTHQAAQYASKIARLLVKLEMYDKAADALRREIGFNQQTGNFGHIGRLVVAVVLVQLGRGDLVAAEKAFKEWGNCCEPQEIETLEALLQAFDDEDAESAAQALSSPFIMHMDVEYAILAKKIPLPRGLARAPKTGVIQNVTSTYTSSKMEGASAPQPTDIKEDEDEEEEGLC